MAKLSTLMNLSPLERFLRQFPMGNTLVLTKGALGTLPPLYSQEHVKDPIARVKFFNPGGAQTWYATEAEVVTDEDGAVEDVRFFGKVTGAQEDELGYFSLRELGEARATVCLRGANGRPIGRFPVRIERDRYFTPCPLSKCR